MMMMMMMIRFSPFYRRPYNYPIQSCKRFSCGMEMTYFPSGVSVVFKALFLLGNYLSNSGIICEKVAKLQNSNRRHWVLKFWGVPLKTLSHFVTHLTPYLVYKILGWIQRP